MPIAGSPKKMAQDIADGFMSLSPPLLRPYTPADLKIILGNLAHVARDLRQEQIPAENVMAAKSKNMKLIRITQAESVIRAWCQKRRIQL